jgi:hypothetical protein
MLKILHRFVIVLSCLSAAACTQIARPKDLLASNTPRPVLSSTTSPDSKKTQANPQRATAAAALTQVADTRERMATASLQTATIAMAILSTPDQTATAQILASAVVAVSKPEIIESYLSPDYQFQAEVIQYDCVLVGGEFENAYKQLKIVKVDDGKEIATAEQLNDCDGGEDYGLGGLFWSPNSRYFYYSYSIGYVADWDICEYTDFIQDMSRVDVTTSLIEVTPGWGELLADGKTMIIPGKGEFILWDLDKGKIGNALYLISDTRLLTYQISSDRNSLVYLLAENCLGSPGKTYLVLWDISLSQHTLRLEVETPPLINITWDNPGELTLWYADSTQRQFNLATGEVVP